MNQSKPNSPKSIANAANSTLFEFNDEFARWEQANYEQ